MQILKLKPTSAGRRHQIVINKTLLNKDSKCLKNLKLNICQNNGRSSQTGHITVRHKGAGHKKLYNKINFTNKKSNSIVLTNLYDAYRNSFVSLRFDLINKNFDVVLMTEFNYPGTLNQCEYQLNELKLGFRTSLINFTTGSFFHSLTLNNDKITYARSAGTFCKLVQKTKNYVKLKLPSGKFLTSNKLKFSVATLGTISNSKYNQTVIGKAGKNRLKGIRPSVRGIAMNPVDHPHGGRTNGGMHPLTPWGIPTRGKPTKKKQ
jgi:large subunit ribosomal protein L2